MNRSSPPMPVFRDHLKTILTGVRKIEGLFT